MKTLRIVLLIAANLILFAVILLWIPVTSRFPSHAQPANDYAGAIKRFNQLQARDGDDLLPECHSMLLSHGEEVTRTIGGFVQHDAGEMKIAGDAVRFGSPEPAVRKGIGYVPRERRLEGLVMFVAVWWFSSKPRPRYAVSGLFALLYGCFRFAIEFVRVPDQQIGDHGYLAFGWLTMGQVLSLPLIALGLSLFWLSRRSPVLQPMPAKG